MVSRTAIGLAIAKFWKLLLIGGIAGTDIHWGLVFGIVTCVVLGLWLWAMANGLEGAVFITPVIPR